MEWAASGSLWSIRLSMTDGRSSGHIGTRNNLADFFTFSYQDKVTCVQMLSSPDNKYVQGFRLLGTKANSVKQDEVLVEAIGLDLAGEWQSFKL